MFLLTFFTNTENSSWYTDAVDRPIKRLRTNLREGFPVWNISLPSDSPCPLTATGNVGGRLINGVSRDAICSTLASADRVQGKFIHIEQAMQSRRSGTYHQWARALKKTFNARCASGMEMNPRTLLCVYSEPGHTTDSTWPWSATTHWKRVQKLLVLPRWLT